MIEHVDRPRKRRGTPRGRQRLSASINVRLTPDQLAHLEAVADRHGVDLAYVARTALDLGMTPADRSIEAAIESAERETAPTIR